MTGPRRLLPWLLVLALGALCFKLVLIARDAEERTETTLAQLLYEREQHDYLSEAASPLLEPVHQRLGLPAFAADATVHAPLFRTITMLQRRLFHNEAQLRGDPLAVGQRQVRSGRRFPVHCDGDRARVELPALGRYRYEILHRGTEPTDGPILYQDVLWDSAPHLLASVGLSSEATPQQRAVALWRFVTEHRRHSLPPTETAEEHDLVRFLSVYGYGFCDDAATALTCLANRAGLAARTWWLEGHVVAELQVAGRWQMFDADLGVYYPSPDGNEIYGVAELAAQPERLLHGVGSPVHEDYVRRVLMPIYSSTADNIVRPNRFAEKTAQLRYRLRPAERVVFTNYNIGLYFVGRYLARPPVFHNGYVACPVTAATLEILSGEALFATAGPRLVVRNPGSEPATLRLPVRFPFPLLGGALRGTLQPSGDVRLLVRDHDNDQQVSRRLEAQTADQPGLCFDGLFALLTPRPTYAYTVDLELAPEASLELEGCEVLSDFQFAPTALLKLQEGINDFRVFEAGDAAGDFELTVWVE